MILNVQQIWTRYLPDTIRERKRERKKTDKIYHPDHSIVDRTSNKIQEPFQNRPYTQCTISKRARYDIGGARPAIVVVRAHVRYHNLWWTIDIRDSGNEPLHRVLWRVLLRCCAWPSVFSPPIVPPLCLSYSPVDPTGRAVSFRRKGGSSSGAGSWPDIVCHTLVSTPTLHLLYSPPFARCTLVNPRFIMRRI